jgi:Beta-glucosidase-related glycosidases
MNSDFPFMDPKKPLAERVADLVARLEPLEKLGLMASRQEAVLRLGLPEYHIGGEAAHGLQCADGSSTTFPQTIGMASTWDEALLREAGRLVSDEARAYYNKRGRSGGLSLWAPTVDMERDPRWGRSEEAYGEDPRLGGRLSSAYIRGMMGDDPSYLKAAPTPKHFFGNNNEKGRCSSSSSIDERNKREYYLAAFEPALAQAKAPSLMTAYNAINGRPAMLRPELEEVVRGEWGFEGFVVCDAGSLPMLLSEHRAFSNLAEAAAAAVKAGVDNFSDDASVVKPALQEAIDRGLLSWADIDRAISRALAQRIRLGQLDPPGVCPYDAIGEAALWDPSHAELARRAAREAIVLLENRPVRCATASGSPAADTDQPFLPYAPAPAAKVALLGPLAAEVYRDWYGPQPPYRKSALAAFAERLGPERVLFDDGCDIVSLAAADGRGIGVVSWFNASLVADRGAGRGGERFRMNDWGWGNTSFRALASGRFVTTDDEKLEAKASEVWGWWVKERFALESASSGSAYIRTWKGEYVGLDKDRRLAVLHEGGSGSSDASSAAAVNAGHSAASISGRPAGAEAFQVEVESEGLARAAALAASADAAFVFVGNHPLLNAKEEIDRDSIALPPEQEKLVEAAIAANPKTVVVIVGSYPFALGPWKDRAAAVLYTAHGGQEAGEAIADAILGAYNPSGRLPMTWYKSLDQIGGILDYDIMRGKRTYRWLEDKPLYPFGYGRSYSRFEYSLESRPQGDGRGGYTVRVLVSNAAGPEGEEVVQLYAACLGSSVKRPLAQLCDFARVRVVAGGKTLVELHVSAEDFAFWDVRQGRWFTESGDWELVVGASSAEPRLRMQVRVEGEALQPRRAGTWIRAASFDDQVGAVLGWSESGDAVSPAAGREAATLRFEDLDFGPGGAQVAEFLGRADRAGVGLELKVDGMPKLSLAATGEGETSLRSRIELPAGRHSVELRLGSGFQLVSYKFLGE